MVHIQEAEGVSAGVADVPVAGELSSISISVRRYPANTADTAGEAEQDQVATQPEDAGERHILAGDLYRPEHPVQPVPDLVSES